MNLDLYHYFSEFENYVYGVFLQYNRIIEDLKFPDLEKFTDPENSKKIPTARLDIYYYTLTWDKLKKIYKEHLTKLINRIAKDSSQDFKSQYRVWRRRIEHLFREFDDKTRNEYEHPSLEFYLVSRSKMWGNIESDSLGNIKAHAGNDQFVIIKKQYYQLIQQLRIDLIDIFVKHFSQKPLTQELIKFRDHIEDNIDSLSTELRNLIRKDNTQGINTLLRLIMFLESFSGEGVQVPKEILHKLYSILEPPN
jgi:hypothetical protein